MKHIAIGAVIGGVIGQLVGIWLLDISFGSAVKGGVIGMVLSFVVTMAIREHRLYKGV